MLTFIIQIQHHRSSCHITAECTTNWHHVSGPLSSLHCFFLCCNYLPITKVNVNILINSSSTSAALLQQAKRECYCRPMKPLLLQRLRWPTHCIWRVSNFSTNFVSPHQPPWTKGGGGDHDVWLGHDLMMWSCCCRAHVMVREQKSWTATYCSLLTLHLVFIFFFALDFILSTVDRGTTASKLMASMSTEEEEEEDRQQSMISHSHYGRHSEPSSEPGGIILIQTAKLLLIVT